jgi:diguanylate cyclase (GGDEF)-like protein
LPRELPALAVLGLVEPSDGDWSRLRGLQYASLARAGRSRIAVHAAGGLLAALACVSGVHFALIGAWLALLGAAVWRALAVAHGMRDADRRRIAHTESVAHAKRAAALAGVWAVPFALAPFVSLPVLFDLWALHVLLVAVGASLMPAVPVATALIAVSGSLAASAAFAWHGAWLLAVLAPAIAAVVVYGVIEQARNFLRTGIAASVDAEKDEVVSLLLREFEEGEADWLWQIDANRKLCLVSPRLAFALGQAPAAIEGQSFIQLIAGPDWDTGRFDPSLHQLADKLKNREAFADLLVRVTIASEQHWWELSGTPKYDDGGAFEGFRGVGSDVTAQRESSDKIAWMARYDPLTQLPNRVLVTESMAEALSTARQWRSRCAFLMIDLDRFKAVNDTLGHLVGDRLLGEVSARLKSVIGDSETCGRLGGDEFAIVIRDAEHLTHVARVADQAIAALSRPYEIDNHTLYIGASVGSAIGPRDGDSVETLMRNADLALYRAKDEGGGCHRLYEPSLHQQAEERRQLEVSLRSALDRGEFQLAYQPVVDTIGEGVVSFEALLRWNSAEHGSVSPAKFIPLAEDTRLIVPIGDWVLREACREATRWPEEIKVAVNVSGEQLLDSGFIPSVVGALAATGLAAQRLEIEVTESIFVRDATTARAALEQIMALGCGIALDDFGTGYSSLAYIRNLRFSTIKVDRSFVQGAAVGNAESLAIIRAVVAMADSLDMSTTAEGVETEKELAMVRELGCRKIQGYYYGRPMPATEARALFRAPARQAG